MTFEGSEPGLRVWEITFCTGSLFRAFEDVETKGLLHSLRPREL